MSNISSRCAVGDEECRYVARTSRLERELRGIRPIGNNKVPSQSSPIITSSHCRPQRVLSLRPMGDTKMTGKKGGRGIMYPIRGDVSLGVSDKGYVNHVSGARREMRRVLISFHRAHGGKSMAIRSASAKKCRG